MDTWERLKFGAAITGTVLVLVGLRGISDLVFPTNGFSELAYKVPGVSDPAVDLASLQRSWPSGVSGTDERTKLRDYMYNIQKATAPVSAEGSAALAPPPPQIDLATALSQADVAKGQQTAHVCMSCHSFDPNGQDGVGPGLWGVVGRNVAAHKSFAYSSAFTAQTGSWTYERLDHYLTNPAKAIPGNKMPFAGIRNAQDRANVIAFLSTLSASRVPFPKPDKSKTAEAPAQPGAGPAPAG